MHYHCEIIMPPTDDVEKQLERILAPFSENDGDSSGAFWDWYQIGGRWSGDKAKAHLDSARVDEFVKELNRRNVTVSGIQFGKQELSPATQIPMVDALWREWFPDSGIEQCPLFRHAGERLVGDVCKFSEVPKGLTCERVIIAGPEYDDDETFKAEWMAQETFWNGLTHVRTDWDMTFAQAVERYHERIASYRDEWRAKHTITPDWLVVTIDYHS